MASVVAYCARVVESRLLGKADGRIAVPAVGTLDSVISPHRTVIGSRRPKRAIPVSIIQNRIVPDLLVQRRMGEGVRGNLLLGIGGVVPKPFIIPRCVIPTSSRPGQIGQCRNLIAIQIPHAGRGRRRSRECPYFTPTVHIVTGAGIIFFDECLILIGLIGRQAVNSRRETTGFIRSSIEVDSLPVASTDFPIPEPVI